MECNLGIVILIVALKLHSCSLMVVVVLYAVAIISHTAQIAEAFRSPTLWSCSVLSIYMVPLFIFYHLLCFVTVSVSIIIIGCALPPKFFCSLCLSFLFE